jgi:hypothetical protein
MPSRRDTRTRRVDRSARALKAATWPVLCAAIAVALAAMLAAAPAGAAPALRAPFSFSPDIEEFTSNAPTVTTGAATS